MTFREFTGKNVEEAIRSAMAEFGTDLGDLDIEILSQGSRGMLGVGGEEARILAAPKSAIAAAETVRADAAATARPPAAEAPRHAPEAPEAPEAAPSDEADAAVGGLSAETDADDQVAELERANRGHDARSRGGRTPGGRGRGGRGRDRDREHAIRESAPREPRADRPSREPAPFVSGRPVNELSDEERETLEVAREVLTEMISLMGIEATVEVATGGDTARLNVAGDDLGRLIGRRGEQLASLQHIVNLIVGRRAGQHHRIAVDVENYRGRREEQLRDVADRAAKRVLQTGKIIQLEAMPAMERRIVHMALLENPKVRTQSVGVEPNRRIVVLPANQVND
ncbi:MAG: Jag N-terminal domain-containing protein [Chloroflexi bacterium]|nr:Jag N-terminal domain-containing protein [Chloroflexota bacterium]